MAALASPSALHDSGRTYVLAPWTCVRGNSASAINLVQDADDWLHLEDVCDATIVVEIANVTNPSGSPAGLVLLYIESAATEDELAVKSVISPIPCAPTAGTAPFIFKTASMSGYPLALKLRYRVAATGAASTFDVTFRIHVSVNRQFYFAPTQLGGCVLWFRADRGLGFANTGVSSWADQSGVSDPNKNLTTGSATAPTLTLMNASYGSQPTLSFSGSAYMTSPAWATTLIQPDTWVVVGNPSTTGVAQVALESDDTTTGQNIQQTAANVIATTTTSAMTSTTQWTTPGAVLAEFNGASSKIFFNNFTTPLSTSGSIANSPAITTGQGSLTLGSSDIQWNLPSGAHFWNGTFAEIIAFNAILTTTQRALLRSYLNQRYALNIS